jgi:AraC family transcriptional regulator
MNHKQSTTEDHSERINRVINYIHNHISEPLPVKVLAAQSHYSLFHFHRIMRSFLGEPLGEYIKRTRMETAAFLLRLSDMKVSEVAWKVGYDTPSSFTKAFKNRFDLSPLEYRNNAAYELNFNAQKNITAMKNLKSSTPKFKTIKAQNVIYTTELGDYNEGAGKAWNRLTSFAKQNRLFGFRNNFYGISYDDPDVTETEKLRYDACMTISKSVEPQGAIGVKSLPEGKYAIFLHMGPYNQLKSSYDYIFGDWVVNNNIELRHSPCMERYLNFPDNTKPEKLKTEILIPVK